MHHIPGQSPQFRAMHHIPISPSLLTLPLDPGAYQSNAPHPDKPITSCSCRTGAPPPVLQIDTLHTTRSDPELSPYKPPLMGFARTICNHL